ncbi:MAG: hypothetical protein WB791_11185 [Waddliaceae bacterium]
MSSMPVSFNFDAWKTTGNHLCRQLNTLGSIDSGQKIWYNAYTNKLGIRGVKGGELGSDQESIKQGIKSIVDEAMFHIQIFEGERNALSVKQIREAKKMLVDLKEKFTLASFGLEKLSKTYQNEYSSHNSSWSLRAFMKGKEGVAAYGETAEKVGQQKNRILTKLIGEVDTAIRHCDEKIRIQALQQRHGVEDESLDLEALNMDERNFVDHNSFSDYVQKFCLNVSIDDAKTFAELGGKYLQDIRSGRTEGIREDQKPMVMACLMWYFMQQACRKGEGFSEGTFVLENEDKSIYDFFVNNGESPEKEGPVVYDRMSSHFPNISNYQHKGIDVNENNSQIPLPAGKRTVVFANIKDLNGGEFFYAKPENYGTKTWAETGLHTWEYLATRPARLGLTNEKPVESYRKEHMPKHCKKLFRDILQAIKNEAELKAKLEDTLLAKQSRVADETKYWIEYLGNNAQYLKEQIFGSGGKAETLIEDHGIAGMHSFCCKVLDVLQSNPEITLNRSSLPQEITAIKDLLEVQFGAEVGKRKGNEVRLDLRQL